MRRYQFIGHCPEPWPVQVLCRVLGGSCAGYDQWRGWAPPPTAPWQVAAHAPFTRHARRYGIRRLRAELRAKGHGVGRDVLHSWLCRHGLRALSTRPQRPHSTVADPAAVVAENRLLGQPAPTAPDRLWVGDITYLPLVGGRRCYLATGAMPARAGSSGGGRPYAHRTRAAGPETSPDAAPTRAGLHYSRRPGQPLDQRGLPGPH